MRVRRALVHLREWSGVAALLLVLTGGVAYAANTIASSDIIDGQVKTADLGADAVTSSKIASAQVKNPDLGPNAASSNTIEDNAVRGVDVRSATLTGAHVVDDSLTNADIDESTLNDPLDPGVEVCRTDGPLHLVGSTVSEVCTLGAFTIHAQCAIDVSDPIAMINVETSVPNAFIVFGPDTNAFADFDDSLNVFSVSARHSTGRQAAKQSVLFAAPDGTQLAGVIGGRANPHNADGDSCDLVVSLVG